MVLYLNSFPAFLNFCRHNSVYLYLIQYPSLTNLPRLSRTLITPTRSFVWSTHRPRPSTYNFPTKMAPQVWLITGSSTGFGAAFVTHLLSRGDKVIACSRNPSASTQKSNPNLFPLKLDPTSSLSDLKYIITDQAIPNFGHIDVLVNNAGTQQCGVIEDLTESELTTQLSVNLLGPIKLAQAILPHFRSRGAGTIVMIGSQNSFVCYPYVGAYGISKHAMKGASEALRKEVGMFGIKVLDVYPGFFGTEILKTDKGYYPAVREESYAPLRGAVVDVMTQLAGNHETGGDLGLGVKAVVDLVKGEGVALSKGKDGANGSTENGVKNEEMPEFIVLGGDALAEIERKCRETLELVEKWKSVSLSTGGSFVTPDV